jgi:hypothetical protein
MAVYVVGYLGGADDVFRLTLLAVVTGFAFALALLGIVAVVTGFRR